MKEFIGAELTTKIRQQGTTRSTSPSSVSFLIYSKRCICIEKQPQNLNLSSPVPPSSPRIRSRGKDIISNGILGPVAENEMIDLTCDTVGGE